MHAINTIIIVIITVIITVITINFYVVTVCFIFDEERMWRSLEVWQISAVVENKRNNGLHEVDENDGNIYICNIYLFIHLSIIF